MVGTGAGAGADPGDVVAETGNAETGTTAITRTKADLTSISGGNGEVESREREYGGVDEKCRVKDEERPTTTESSSSASDDHDDEVDGNSSTREKTKSTIGREKRQAIGWRVYDVVFWVPENCEFDVFSFVLRFGFGRDMIECHVVEAHKRSVVFDCNSVYNRAES